MNAIKEMWPVAYGGNNFIHNHPPSPPPLGSGTLAFAQGAAIFGGSSQFNVVNKWVEKDQSLTKIALTRRSLDLPQVYFQRAHGRHTALREIYLQDQTKRDGAGAWVLACWWVSGNRLVASLEEAGKKLDVDDKTKLKQTCSRKKLVVIIKLQSVK